MVPSPTSSNILTVAKTRTELRAFILTELPGWDHWLTLAAAEVQRQAWDEHLLKTEDQLITDIRKFAAEFAAGVGPDAKRFFMPFMQQRPDYPLDRDHAALEPFMHTAGDLPFSHADLAGRMPSRVLIGLIGALGLRRHELQTGERKPGRPPDRRLAHALDWVFSALVPFVRGYGGDAGKLVVPDESHRDVAVPEDAHRRRPVPLALAAVVAVYLSLPNRGDTDAPAVPEQLELGPNALKDTSDRLRELARELGKARREREELQSFDIDAELAKDRG